MQRILGFSIGFLFVLVTRTEAGRHEPRSLLDYFLDAEIVAICTLENAIPPNNELPKGQVEFVFHDVLRTHAIIKEKKRIVHPEHVPATKVKHIIAIKLQEKTYFALDLDPQGEVERFVRASITLKDKSQVGRARLAFDFLLSPNKSVADSADIEFSRTSYDEIRRIAATVTPDPCLKVVQNPNASYDAVRWTALLLGHCGKKEHASVLRNLIEKSKVHSEVFIGIVLLDRENGWRTVTNAFVGKETPFINRYRALQAVRFFHSERKDVVDEKMCAAAVALVLNFPDMADFAVDDLRKWQRWEYCDTILKLPLPVKEDAGKVLRKAILRFALHCPTQEAKDLVKAERARDRELVEEVEYWLALERGTQPPKK